MKYSIGIMVSYYFFIINYYYTIYKLLKPHGYNVRARLSDWDLAESNEQANPHVTETEPQWALHLESPFDPSSRAS